MKFCDNLSEHPFFFVRVWAILTSKKKGFSKKYHFWKCLRKNFLRTSVILCRYLECSLGSGLSFYNFRMVIRHFWKILLMKNEKVSVFTKRDVDQGLCKGWKTPLHDYFRGLKKQKKWDLKSKIRAQQVVALDLENKPSTHYVVFKCKLERVHVAN